jgi:hypothetical protein
MTLKDFQEILSQNSALSILQEDDWNEDYSIAIPLTVKEIRELAEILRHGKAVPQNDKQKLSMFNEIVIEKNGDKYIINDFGGYVQAGNGEEAKG